MCTIFPFNASLYRIVKENKYFQGGGKLVFGWVGEKLVFGVRGNPRASPSPPPSQMKSCFLRTPLFLGDGGGGGGGGGGLVD